VTRARNPSEHVDQADERPAAGVSTENSDPKLIRNFLRSDSLLSVPKTSYGDDSILVSLNSQFLHQDSLFHEIRVDHHRNLATALQHHPTARIAWLSFARARRPCACLRCVASSANPASSAGHARAGAKGNAKLTSNLDHSVGADQLRPFWRDCIIATREYEFWKGHESREQLA